MNIFKSIVVHIGYLNDIVAHPLNKDNKLRAILKYFLWNFARRMIVADYVISITDKCRIIISNDENYSTLLYTEGLYDYHEMLFLMHLLKKEDVFFDIGANVGVYSNLIGTHVGCRCVCFEPVFSTFEKLLSNIRLNKIDDIVSSYRVCVGSNKGEVVITNNVGGLNHIVKNMSEESLTETVPVVCLDDFDKGLNPTAIKIDVEGFEMEVLKGGACILLSDKLKAIVIELNGSGARYGYTDSDINLYLNEKGFKQIKYDGNTRNIEYVDDLKVEGMNAIYVRSGAIVFSP